MPTDGSPSRFPPNHAAISRPPGSAMVVAWHDGVGISSATNSDATTGVSGAAAWLCSETESRIDSNAAGVTCLIPAIVPPGRGAEQSHRGEVRQDLQADALALLRV